jgi:uncharacterized protein YerC
LKQIKEMLESKTPYRTIAEATGRTESAIGQVALRLRKEDARYQ